MCPKRFHRFYWRFRRASVRRYVPRIDSGLPGAIRPGLGVGADVAIRDRSSNRPGAGDKPPVGRIGEARPLKRRAPCMTPSLITDDTQVAQVQMGEQPAVRLQPAGSAAEQAKLIAHIVQAVDAGDEVELGVRLPCSDSRGYQH